MAKKENWIKCHLVLFWAFFANIIAVHLLPTTFVRLMCSIKMGLLIFFSCCSCTVAVQFRLYSFVRIIKKRKIHFEFNCKRCMRETNKNDPKERVRHTNIRRKNTFKSKIDKTKCTEIDQKIFILSFPTEQDEKNHQRKLRQKRTHEEKRWDNVCTTTKYTLWLCSVYRDSEHESRKTADRKTCER